MTNAEGENDEGGSGGNDSLGRNTVFITPSDNVITPLNPLSVLMLIILVLCVVSITVEASAVSHDNHWNRLVRGQRRIEPPSICPYFNGRTFNLTATPLIQQNILRESALDPAYIFLNCVYLFVISVYLIFYCWMESLREKLSVVKFWFLCSAMWHLACAFIMISVLNVRYDNAYTSAIDHILDYEKKYYHIKSNGSESASATATEDLTLTAKEDADLPTLVVSKSFLPEEINAFHGVPDHIAYKIHEQCQALRQIFELCVEIKPLVHAIFPPQDEKVTFVTVKGLMCLVEQLEELGFCQDTTSKSAAMVISLIMAFLSVITVIVACSVNLRDDGDGKKYIPFLNEDLELEGRDENFGKVRRSLLEKIQMHPHRVPYQTNPEDPADAYQDYECRAYQDDVYDASVPPLCPKYRMSKIELKGPLVDVKRNLEMDADDWDEGDEIFLQVAYNKYPD